jgi:uncharacterized Tic20 family protein
MDLLPSSVASYHQLGLEYIQRPMTVPSSFAYVPSDSETEKASNSYLMSLIALMAGLPLPIINLIATFIFYLGNRKGTYFVRWHCTQALLSQFFLLFINSFSFYMTVSIIFGERDIDNMYIAYIITAVLFNIAEFIATIYTAIRVRNGHHVEWWFYGPLSNLICKP